MRRSRPIVAVSVLLLALSAVFAPGAVAGVQGQGDRAGVLACGSRSASVTYYDSVYSGYATLTLQWGTGRVDATNRLPIDVAAAIGNVSTGGMVYPASGGSYAIVLSNTNNVAYVSVPRSGTTIALQIGRWGAQNARLSCRVP